jgi:hypothetical protein
MHREPILAHGSPPLTLETGVAALWFAQFMRSEVMGERLPSSMAPLVRHCETTLSTRYPALSREMQGWIARAPEQIEGLLREWGGWPEMRRQSFRNSWAQQLPEVNHALGLPEPVRAERDTGQAWADLAVRLRREGKIDDAGLVARLQTLSQSGFAGARGIAANIR